jgi:hypothetical protein
MKKIKLTNASVLILVMALTLVVTGGIVQADPKSNSAKMTSSVFCATGGKAQSSNCKLTKACGGQSSPIGPQFSPHFGCGPGWLYTTGPYNPTFIRGDANRDGVIDASDLVYLLNYLFANGPEPQPLAAGDATWDGVVDIADVVYLLNYLFVGGPPPTCDGKNSSTLLVSAKLNQTLSKAKIGLSVPTLPEGSSTLNPQDSRRLELEHEYEVAVWGKFDQDVAGLQLEISYDPKELTLLKPELTPLTSGLSIFFGEKEGLQKIGIVDLSGKNLIPSGEGALVTLKAKGKDLRSIRIEKAILVDREAKHLLVDISPNMSEFGSYGQVKTENAAAEIPDHFALLQNYPNPFNPQTKIEYALSRDADVKLTIYNILGEQVNVLVDEHQTAGYKKVYWDGKDQRGEEVASGVYFYRLETKEFSKVKKMLLVK